MEQEPKNAKMSRRQLLQSGAVTTAALAVTAQVLRAADAVGATTTAGGTAQPKATSENPGDILATLRRERPRLLATPATWEKLKKRRGADPLFDGFLRRSETEARAIVPVAPVTYQKQGKRLLHVSRQALRRVLLLAMHYHLTGDQTLAKRAEQEMLAAAAFSDWNPSHFLDVGEMTAALAFGYDWLYNQLSPEARQTIATAIIEKGLKPGLGNPGWARTENNWNQVCLGGLSLGALALAEQEPALAAQILDMTKNFNSYGLKPYAPDGVYPEGAMYWGYGTTFQTVLLDALQTALGTDWGLSKSPGFMKSAGALFQQLAPTGTFFNFADNVERIGSEPAMWWFARELRQPELLRYELARLKEYIDSKRPPQPETQNDRLLPLAALWWPETPISNTVTTQPLNWYGHAPNPLAIFRSAWNDPNAMYLALKGGKATLSHGHMDAGSFIFEANGVRWAYDLGMQDYYSLESKGVDLWNKGQNAGRWSVFRLNNLSHSTLTINNQRHIADGHAAITHFSAANDSGAIVDLSPVFKGYADKVTRGFVFRSGSHALIRDEIEGLKEGDMVRWAMLTRAEIAIAENGTEATLTQNGQKLRVLLAAATGAKFEVLSAEAPVNSYDVPNPGARLLIVNLVSPASGRLHSAVILQPFGQIKQPTVLDEKLAQTALSQWPQAPLKSA